ncbi:MAG: S-layer domain-containing protein [Desulfotomaculum sp. 46_296]|nr:MAG: S-layer domain-containing protein [Desulfotomaculum sp. 46_296]HAU31959.1 hypothetical protein [Desulfotomaculum sp.]
MKPSKGQRILAVMLCALLAFSAAFYFPQQQARADTIDNIVSELNKVYTMLNEDPAGKNAVNNAKEETAALPSDPASDPWPAVFSLLPTTAFEANFGGGDNAKQAIVNLLRDAAALTYSTDGAALRTELGNFKTTHQDTVNKILESGFTTVDELYDFLFVKAKAKAPDALSGLTSTDLNKILAGNYTDSVKNWTREALKLSDTAFFGGKFQTKLGLIGWSIDSLVDAKEEIRKVVDPDYKAEKALLKAYVRSESKFYKDGNPLSAVSLSAGCSTPCELQLLGINPDSDIGSVINLFLKWKTGAESIAKVEGGNLKAVAAGQTTLIAYKNDPATDWIFKGTVTVSAPSGGGGGGPGPTPSPVPSIDETLEQLAAGEITPEQTAGQLSTIVSELKPEEITGEVKSQIQDAVSTIMEKAGTIPADGLATTTTGQSTRVEVGTEAIAAALARLNAVNQELAAVLSLEGIERPEINVVLNLSDVNTKVLIVRYPRESLPADADLEVISPAAKIIIQGKKTTTASIGNLLASSSASWLAAADNAAQQVEVEINTLSTQEVSPLISRLPSTAAEKMTLAGKVVRAEVKTVRGNTSSAYTGPVRIKLFYEQSRVKDTELLGGYAYNETTGKWDYAGGKVNTKEKTVAVKKSGLNNYAVMEYDRTFSDAATHWAKREIKVMAARHLVKGSGAEIFSPDRQTTRAEFAVILARMMNLAADPAAAGRFADIPANAWYRGMVGAAAKAGLVAGTGATTFAPNDPITREQMAAMITRLMAKQPGGLTITDQEANNILAALSDASAVSSWARKSVALMVRENVMNGRQVNTFVPAGKSTRAEGTVVLYRVSNKI